MYLYDMLLNRSVRINIDQACNEKFTRRKHTPLYEKGTKPNQNKPMETTTVSCLGGDWACLHYFIKESWTLKSICLFLKW